MASKTSPPEEEPVIRMGEFGRRIAARRVELGLSTDPYDLETCRRLRNSGANRTPSKRALLAEIGKLGGKW